MGVTRRSIGEYRPVPDARLEDYRSVTGYAFQPTAGPYDPDADVEERRERMWSHGDRRGLFDGEERSIDGAVPSTATPAITWTSRGRATA